MSNRKSLLDSLPGFLSQAFTATSLGLLLSAQAFASAGANHLTPSERSSLRYHLENAFNEVDLLVKNSKIDRQDVRKQERDFQMLQVFEKFPVATPQTLKTEWIKGKITKSAEEFGLKLNSIRKVEVSRPDRPIPVVMPADAEDFKFTPDQLSTKVRLELVFKGTKRQLQDWMNTWTAVYNPEEKKANALPLTPYLEWDSNALTSLPEVLPGSRWKLHAQMVFFRDIHYPKLQPQNPIRFLPSWAKRNPATFQKEEPQLWSLIEKTQQTTPKALPNYEVREQFQLNSERMTFFTSKVTQFN